MATLKVLGAGPVKRGITRIAEQFAKHSGHQVAVEFTGAPSVRERVLAGEAVDVAVVPAATMDEFAAAGRVADTTRTTLGRSRMGLAMRKGAEAPDLSTVESFKGVIAAADAVVANVANSGNYVAKLVGDLGFAADKVQRQPDAVKVMEQVASSPQKLLGAGQLPEIRELIDKGVAIELAGALPEALQSVTAYDAAVTAASANAAAAAFTEYLKTPASRAAMAATGID
ncbi:MAG: substrate-binding domain-containing protein [Burkholderiales bacterium]|nr:substrate-binding domain-containing protein [Burkholderiales bacterium]